METLTAKTKSIDELHAEHQSWVEDLQFYKDELKIFNNQLEKMSTRNVGIDFRKEIEHFQNQFTIQKGELDILNHDITVHEQWLAGYAKENPTTIEKEKFADHKVMKEQVEMFRKIYSDLKKEYQIFLKKWK